MASNFFIDINILVDYFLPKRENHLHAKLLFQKTDGVLVRLFCSETVINTTSYLLRKAISKQDFAVILNDLLVVIELLPCSSDIMRTALKNAKNDFEDAVLYHIALAGKMDYFVTSDQKDFKKLEQPALPVVSSKKMTSILSN